MSSYGLTASECALYGPVEKRTDIYHDPGGTSGAGGGLPGGYSGGSDYETVWGQVPGDYSGTGGSVIGTFYFGVICPCTITFWIELDAIGSGTWFDVNDLTGGATGFSYYTPIIRGGYAPGAVWTGSAWDYSGVTPAGSITLTGDPCGHIIEVVTTMSTGGDSYTYLTCAMDWS